MSGCSGGGSAIPKYAPTDRTASTQAIGGRAAGGLANNHPRHRRHKHRGPAVPVQNLVGAAMVPPSDPAVDARRTSEHNPPVDVAATIEFNQHRIQGMPRSVGASPVRRPHGGASREPQNDVLGGAGQTGTYISNQFGAASAYEGMYAGHSGWNAAEFGYNQENQLLYGPTGRPPYSCIEVGTAYRPGTGTPPQVYAYDFCDPRAPVDINSGRRIGSYVPLFNIDGNFRSTFERNFGDGVPQYTIEILPNPDGRWTAYLYNWVASLFLPYYTSQSANYNDGFLQPPQGWDIFEPKYTTGTCVSAPQTEANAIQGYNIITHTWTSWTNVPTAGEGPAVSTSCIGFDDGSGDGFYYVYVPNSVASWNVYSEANYVPPPPGCDPNVDCCDPWSCCDPTIDCCTGFDPGCCSFGDPSCCDPSFDYCCGYGYTNTGPCSLSTRRHVTSTSSPTRVRAAKSRTAATRSGPLVRRFVEGRYLRSKRTNRLKRWSS